MSDVQGPCRAFSILDIALGVELLVSKLLAEQCGAIHFKVSDSEHYFASLSKNSSIACFAH